MALMRRARGTNDNKEERGLKGDEYVPSSAWTEDAHAHFLLVDLPGFKKEDVRLQVEASGQVSIKGERRANDKIHSFEKTYKVPEGADITKISGKFENEFLYITIPKHIVIIQEKKNNSIQDKLHETIENIVEKAEPAGKHEKKHVHEELLPAVHGDSKKHTQSHSHEIDEAIEKIDEKKKEMVKKQKNMLEKAAKEFKCNKMGFVLTAILAFSLGVLVGCNVQAYGRHGSSLHDSIRD